jgi:broad specificity phosphatase PhoE
MTQVDFLRHGHCLGGEIFRGSTDVELSPEGWQQLRSKVSGHETRWDHIVSSPLQRCRQFAEELSRQSKTPLTVDERWREMSFGDWEGREVKEIWKSDKASAIGYFTDPERQNTANIEPVEDIIHRLSGAWQTILDEHSGKRVLVVAHGGVIRFQLAAVLDLPLKAVGQIQLPYAAISRITAQDTLLGYREVVQFINGTLDGHD